MTSLAEEQQWLAGYLLVDRQVYDARRWSRAWLAVTGTVLFLVVARILLLGRGLGMADVFSLAVIALAGASLSRCEYVATRKLLQLKCETFAHRFDYLHALGERFKGDFTPRRRWAIYVWPTLFVALKLRLVFLLLVVLGVSLLNGEPVGQSICACALALAFLFLADAIIERRRVRFDRDIRRFYQDSGVSLELKEKIILALERERNGRF